MKLLRYNDYEALKENLKDPSCPSVAISFVNPYSYYLILDSVEFDSIDGFFVDGMLLVALLKMSGVRDVPRISFDYSSIASDFFKFLSDYNLTFSFVGATQDEVLPFKSHLERFYPKLRLISYRHGYFDSWDDAVIFVNNAPSVDVVLIGAGAPFQERLSILFKNSGRVRLAITCGGFISQTASSDDYYYPLVKRLNLRWTQRLVMHQHVRSKFIKTYPKFVIRFVAELINKWLFGRLSRSRW